MSPDSASPSAAGSSSNGERSSASRKRRLGQITGGGFVGFGIVILIASLFLDRFGYKPFLMLAGVLHVVSVIVTVAATFVYSGAIATDPDAARAGAYFCLFWGIFIFAIANGICEAVVNPLVATLYRKQKTHYLNILHAGWPGGMIAGALLGVVMIGRVHWEIVLALYLVPALIYILMIVKEKFPQSEATAAGVKFGDMVKEFAAPMLLFLLVLHVCIGYVELGTDSWIVNIMDTVLGGKGLFILLYTSILMFVLRFFAGPIVQRINPLGLLFSSAVLATIGLYALGSFAAAAAVMVAATIYGVGKTFFWPTMLGVVSERFPKGGALTLGAVGGVGMLSAGLLGGPGIGYMQDRYASQDLQEQRARRLRGVQGRGHEPVPVLPRRAGVGRFQGRPRHGEGQGLQHHPAPGRAGRAGRVVLRRPERSQGHRARPGVHGARGSSSCSSTSGAPAATSRSSCRRRTRPETERSRAAAPQRPPGAYCDGAWYSSIS